MNNQYKAIDEFYSKVQKTTTEILKRYQDNLEFKLNLNPNITRGYILDKKEILNEELYNRFERKYAKELVEYI